MFFQPITVSFDIDQPAVAKQPIDDGRSDNGAPEDGFVKVLEKDVPEVVQAEPEQADGAPVLLLQDDGLALVELLPDPVLHHLLSCQLLQTSTRCGLAPCGSSRGMHGAWLESDQRTRPGLTDSSQMEDFPADRGVRPSHQGRPSSVRPSFSYALRGQARPRL